MSLTTELRDPDSAISCWFKARESPTVVGIVKNHNAVMAMQQVISPIEGTDFPLVGKAVTFYLRKYLAAHLGDARWIEKSAGGEGAVKLGLSNLIEFVNSEVKSIEEEALKCLLLAAAEDYWRIGKVQEFIQPFIKTSSKTFKPDKTFLNKWSPTITDTAQIIRLLPPTWQDAGFTPKDSLISNATFPNSRKIGGADAQIIVGGAPVEESDRAALIAGGSTLIDVRTTAKRRPFTLENFYQQLSYCLLDRDNKYKITHLGWFYTRQQSLFVYPVNRLFRDIASVRHEFNQMIEDNYDAQEFDDNGYDLIAGSKHDYYAEVFD